MLSQPASVDTIINWETVRAQFPVLQQEVNGMPLVYLDNGASSQMPLPVIERINAYHHNEHANVHRGIHTLSQAATNAYEATRGKIQRLLNAASEREIIYTTGTTDSINLVANSWGMSNLTEGDEILLSHMEHHANIVPWQMIAERTGAIIKAIPVTENGELDMDTFHELLSPKTKILAIIHVSNVLGTVNPVKEMIASAHSVGAVTLLDGAQSVPHSKVDVRDLDCDFFTFSAHKMCGPTGFGILYGKMELLEAMPPYRGGGDMIDKVSIEKTTYNDVPLRFEAGTPPIAAGIGLGAAADYMMSLGMDSVQQREQELLDYATEKISSMDGVRIIGTSRNKASVISFMLDGIHPTDAGTILDQKGIAVRTGHHCAQPLMDWYNIPGTARASISFYNNRKDIDALAEGIHYVQSFFD
ncbi:MAG: cysteine desulfurase [Bacteroidota bacterium]